MTAPRSRAEGLSQAEELLKLDGKELVAAADDASISFYRDECPYTASELIAVSEKLVSEVKSIDSERDDRMNPWARYFEQACAKANDQELDKLVEIYARLDPRSSEKSAVLTALASRLVSREVASIRAEKRKVTLAKTEVDVSVKLSPLEITLANQDRLNAPAPQKVFLYFTPHREEDDTSIGLPNALDGSYEVWVGATGDDVYRYGYEVPAQCRLDDTVDHPPGQSDARRGHETIDENSRNYRARAP